MIPVSALALGIWGILVFILERAFPAAASNLPSTRIITNLALGALVLIASPLVQWATQNAVGNIRPLFTVGNVLLHLIILDLWAYLLHRAYHRIPLMWRMHSVHHLDETLDVTSAIRFHVFEVLWSSLLRLIPLLAFGIALETNILYGAILTACAMFHHSNVRLPPRFEKTLSAIIVTPAIHWVHHHAVQRDTDSNYASILSIWDHIFRSRSKTKRTPDLPIGIEGHVDQPLTHLLVWPMRRSPQ